MQSDEDEMTVTVSSFHRHGIPINGIYQANHHDHV